MGSYIPFRKNGSHLEKITQDEKKEGKRIILTGGSFDITPPHSVHINYLRECKKFGDILIVNVAKDERIKFTKKDSKIPRPIFEEEIRAFNISAIDAVDYVTIHPYVYDSKDDSPEIGPTARLAKILKPDVIVKGIPGWHQNEKTKLKNFLGYDVELKHVKIKEDISSTSILEYLLEFPGKQIKKRNFKKFLKSYRF